MNNKQTVMKDALSMAKNESGFDNKFVINFSLEQCLTITKKFKISVQGAH